MTPAITTQLERPGSVPAKPRTQPECNCPHDCERDHDNE
jgi:hypothetical protein